MRIGFIGIGNMGSELARHLLAAGHTLTTYARGKRSRERAGSLGLNLVLTPVELARQLLAAGHTLTTYARGKRSRERAGSLGLNLVLTPVEVAAASEVVFTMVTTGSDVESVALGPEGFMHAVSPGLIHVDLSTISPAFTPRRRATARTRHRHA